MEMHPILFVAVGRSSAACRLGIMEIMSKRKSCIDPSINPPAPPFQLAPASQCQSGVEGDCRDDHPVGYGYPVEVDGVGIILPIVVPEFSLAPEHEGDRQ